MTDITEVGSRGDSPHVDDAPTRRPRPGARGLAVLAAVLVVVLVAAVVYAAIAAGHVRAYDQQQRDDAAAAAVAEQFALRMDNFDSAHLGRYTRSIEKLLSTKAKAKFDPVFKQFVQAYQQGNVSGQGHVLVSGVANADQDSATVLVVHDMTAKSDTGTLVHHYRWNVSLVKVQDRWLVDNFTQVG